MRYSLKMVSVNNVEAEKLFVKMANASIAEQNLDYTVDYDVNCKEIWCDCKNRPIDYPTIQIVWRQRE